MIVVTLKYRNLWNFNLIHAVQYIITYFKNNEYKIIFKNKKNYALEI
jgi:hypothetical protein